jgi:hypothetical protein
MEAARELMRRVKGSEHILEPEREDALEAVRTLDRHHIERLRDVHQRFKAEWNPDERTVVAEHRQEVQDQLEDASALVVAGGHVAVLLYRLRLLSVAELIPSNLPIVAWSAGAMALAERVVLFHDSPPQGQGNPEVLEAGLGLARGVLPFPHARRRLRVQDPVRMASLSRRFTPNACVAMDEGAQLHYRNNQWAAREGTFRLSASGELVEFAQ